MSTHESRDVAGELSIQLVPFVDRILVERLDPSESGLVQAKGEVGALHVVVATSIFNG
jgi:ABC-type methionine transport system permease subunit